MAAVKGVKRRGLGLVLKKGLGGSLGKSYATSFLGSCLYLEVERGPGNEDESSRLLWVNSNKKERSHA